MYTFTKLNDRRIPIFSTRSLCVILLHTLNCRSARLSHSRTSWSAVMTGHPPRHAKLRQSYYDSSKRGRRAANVVWYGPSVCQTRSRDRYRHLVVLQVYLRSRALWSRSLLPCKALAVCYYVCFDDNFRTKWPRACGLPVKAKFHYAIWSQPGPKLVADLLARASSLLAS